MKPPADKKKAQLMVEISVLLLILYTILVVMAFMSKNALKPMSDFLEAALSERNIPSHFVNSYSKSIKNKNITSIEQLNYMLTGRLEELKKSGLGTEANNENRTLIVLMVLYAASFAVFFAIVVDIYSTILLGVFVVLIIAGLIIEYKIIRKIGENEARIINAYLEKQKPAEVNLVRKIH